MTAQNIIDALGLSRHPEGGWYRETWRAATPEGRRPSATMIYYLLEAGDVSHWHRIDACEIWSFHTGAPLSITLSPNGHEAETHRLGPEVSAFQRPQVIVPPGWWQTAVSLGPWTLVGCMVSPGFTFEGFELAPADWRPTPRREMT